MRNMFCVKCEAIPYIWLIDFDSLKASREQAYLSYKFGWLARRRLGVLAPSFPARYFWGPNFNILFYDGLLSPNTYGEMFIRYIHVLRAVKSSLPNTEVSD